MSAVAMLLVAGLLTAAGGRLAATLAPQGDRSERLALAFVAGLVAAYPIWLVVDAAGIGWWVLTLLASAGIVALLGHGLHRAIGTDVRSDSNGAGRRLALGWGDALAAVSCSTRRRARGQALDRQPRLRLPLGYQGSPLLPSARDRPRLPGGPQELARPPGLPEPHPLAVRPYRAHPGRVRRERDDALERRFPRSARGVGPGRARARRDRSLVDPGERRRRRAWRAASSSVGFLAAGGADLPVALAPILAWPALTRRETSAADDLRVGLAAALAAAAKIEGVPMGRPPRDHLPLRQGRPRAPLPPARLPRPNGSSAGRGRPALARHGVGRGPLRLPRRRPRLGAMALHPGGASPRGGPGAAPGSALAPTSAPGASESSGEPAASHWCSPGSWASTSTSTSATRCPPRIARPSSPRRTSAGLSFHLITGDSAGGGPMVGPKVRPAAGAVRGTG